MDQVSFNPSQEGSKPLIDSKHFKDLVTYAVQQRVSENGGVVFGALACNGRCTVRGIEQTTHLKLLQIEAALLELLQLQLVRHSSVDYEAGDDTEYEVNQDAAYSLTIRDAKFQAFVEQAYSKTSASDFIPELTCNGPKHMDSYFARFSNEIQGPGSPYEVFCRLLHDGMIRSVTKYDINPEWDLRHEAERIVELNGLPERVTSAKQGTALRQLEIDKILREWRDQADAFVIAPQTASKKRARSHEPEPANSRKRRKTLGKPYNGVSEDTLNEANGLPLPNGSALPGPPTYEVPSLLLKSNIAIRENHDKCKVIMRNRRLHRLASKILGNEVGCVYDIVLWLVELQTRRSYGPLEINSNNEEQDKLTMQESPVVTLQQIQQEIVRRPRPEFNEIFGPKPNGDISQSINGINGHTSGDDLSSDIEEDGPVQKRRRLSKQGDPSPSGHLNSRLKKIESYLEILCASPERFLRRRGAGYVVPYGRLTPLLMEEALYDHIASHPSLGAQCARVVRILAWVGNCDEKMVSDRAMIPLAEARQILTRLWNSGLIDVYPVARDNQRTASRSIYIYRFDFTAVRVKIIGDCYKSMFNLLRTLQEAKRRAHFVLEKAERSDVKGNEDKYLTAGEQEALRQVRKNEDRILMHVDALDDLVGALRDWWPMDRHVPTLREEFGLKRSTTTNEVVRRDTQENDEDEKDGEEILPGRASEPPTPTSETEQE